MNNELVEYCNNHLYKEVMIAINGVNISVRVPIKTTWILLENNRLYVTSSKTEPQKSEGFVNGHNGNYEEYPHYKDDYKQFLGHLCMEHRGLKHWRV